MGMISTLKVGYKTTMLRCLLAIVDDPEQYVTAVREGARAKSGMKGIQHAHEPHVWDAMVMCMAAWGADDPNAKYATQEGITRCWRKALILPAA